MESDDENTRTIALKPARYFLRILAGIGGAFAGIGMMLVAFIAFPSLAGQQVDAIIASVAMMALLGGLVHAAQRWVAGPPLVLELSRDRVRILDARSGCEIAAAPLASIRATLGVNRSRAGRTPVLDLDLGTHHFMIAVHLTVADDADKMGEPTHTADPTLSALLAPLVPSMRSARRMMAPGVGATPSEAQVDSDP